MLEYDQITRFYIDAISYRAELTRRCKRDGMWRTDTYEILIAEMLVLSVQMGEALVVPFSKFESAIAIAHEFARTQREGVNHRDDFLRVVDNLVKEIVQPFVTNRHKVRNERWRLIRRSIQNIRASYRDIATVGAS
jgi:hypothetical protein